MTMWKPGMRCVYIGGGVVLTAGEYPVQNVVYTVRRNQYSGHNGEMLLWFEELRNDDVAGRIVAGVGRFADMEPGFGAKWFRPLSETRLDQFRHYLAPTTSHQHYANQIHPRGPSAPKPKVEERV